MSSTLPVETPKPSAIEAQHNSDLKAEGVEAHNQTDVKKKEEFGVEQVAVLRNGFSIKHERREIVGDLTRLYVNADGSAFIDVPTAKIGHFQAAPPEPVEDPASGKKAFSLHR